MSRALPPPESCDSIPKLLLHNAATRGPRPAIREKDFGIWQNWTWADVLGEVRALACGLAALGLGRGDKLAIIGDNRPQLYWSMVAAQAIGAIPVPMYQDAVANELQYVLDHAEARFAVAEDQEQVDKLLEIKDRCPRLETIVFDDSRGMRNYGQAFLKGFDAVQQAGHDYDAANPGFFDNAVAAAKGADIAIMLYTSGTTGQPKGVMLTFDNVIISARNTMAWDNLSDADDIVAYLPMAWVGDNVFSMGQSYVCGFCVNCPESSATVMQDIREIGPTYFFAPPAIFENILTQVMIRMEDAGAIKRRMFHYFMSVARRVGSAILDGRPAALGDRLLYWLGNILVFAPLRNTLGFSRVRLAYTAGEAIGPEIFDFYRSLGMNLKQLYGQTEATVFITMHADGDIKADTVGPPGPGIELRIDDSGEVLYRSPGVFHGYYKNPEATSETKTADGWVHTGDAGIIDSDGHLKIIDRAKDVGRLNDGAVFAPKYLENKLKFYPHIKEVVAFGDGRDNAGCMICIDVEAVGSWAERRGIAYASYQELAAHPEVYDLIESEIAEVNRDLAKDAQLASSQIHRFLLLHKELDADDGELTRTRKVRRRFIADKYDAVIAALYSTADQAHIETEVTYEDGRKGTTQADLVIRRAAIMAGPAALDLAS
ncbi:MAG: AMP-binding protein [Pseudomonadota bacterium]|nr:AMP-binding protein [Pseudomonadota bacterium]